MSFPGVCGSRYAFAGGHHRPLSGCKEQGKENPIPGAELSSYTSKSTPTRLRRISLTSAFSLYIFCGTLRIHVWKKAPNSWLNTCSRVFGPVTLCDLTVLQLFSDDLS